MFVTSVSLLGQMNRTEGKFSTNKPISVLFLSLSAHTLNKLLTSFLTTGSESILEHIIDTFAHNEAPVV